MTTTIADTFRNPAGTGVGGVVVRATLVAASEVLTGGGAIIREAETTTAADGSWSLALTPIADLLVAGGAYYLITADGHRWTVNAPSDAGPHTLDAVMVVPGPLPDVGGVGGGAVDSVNGHTGVVVLTAADVSAVPTTRTVNGHALSGNVTVTAGDVGADATGTAAGLIAALTPASIGAVPTSRTVAGHALTADVTLAKGDVGLGNVDNTSDANKPVSTATQTALDAKAPLASPTFTGTAVLPAVTRTGRTKRTPTALSAAAATIPVDSSLNDDFTVTLGAAGPYTLGAPSNPPTGSDTQRLLIAIKQDATGSRTLTLDTSAGGYAFGTDITSITLTTTAGKTDYLGVQWNPGTSKWDVIAFAKGY